MKKKPQALFNSLQRELLQIKKNHLYRSLKELKGQDFISNDYLGFSSHPAIRKAMIKALREGIPLSSKSSRLLGGSNQWHKDTESRLKKFIARPSALIFPSGYQANVGVLSSLAKGRTVFSDSFNHASLIDGIRLSRSLCHIYPHNNLEILESLLKYSSGKKLIVTESLFSMTGDFAPLEELSFLALKYKAFLYVDEAHTTGLFGSGFSGRVKDLKQKEHIITLHTFGKALGSFGAFIGSLKVIREYLINKSRSFIYTTAPPPLLMAQWQAALDILQKESYRPLRLRKKALDFRKSLSDTFPLEKTESPIVSIVLGSPDLALKKSLALRKRGFQVLAIRYPTVPKGKEGLRLMLQYSHTKDMLNRLAEALKKLA